MSSNIEKRSPSVDSSIDEVRLLRFSVFEPTGREIQYGINTHKIREVIEWENLSPLAESLRPFIGIYDLRGVPVPVIDVSMKLVHCPTERKEHPRPRILICEVMRRLVGLLVQKTSQISVHASEAILPTPEDLVSVPDVFINGLIKGAQGNFIYLLDIEAFLSAVSSSSNESTPQSIESLQGTKVLIVEDSKLFQKKAVQYFRDLQCTFDVVGDGQKGLEKLRASTERQYDVVFTDIEMPVMNGIEMALAIKSDERLKDIPLVFNSSISNPTLIEEIRQRNLGEYVVKFEPKSILEAIKNALKKRSA
jgi:two-component system chemotaxis response regulator CheV